MPLSEYCLVNTAMCGKCQLLWVQFCEWSEKNRFFPLLLSKPPSMWGITDTIQGKPVSPHTSHPGEGASEWMKLKHRQNLGFPFTPLRAHSLAPDHANAPPFEL